MAVSLLRCWVPSIVARRSWQIGTPCGPRSRGVTPDPALVLQVDVGAAPEQAPDNAFESAKAPPWRRRSFDERGSTCARCERRRSTFPRRVHGAMCARQAVCREVHVGSAHNQHTHDVGVPRVHRSRQRRPPVRLMRANLGAVLQQ